ncbi:hypothetical protein L6452_43994 [Arctium lappa]|uniref:Uncharacterized protein n=1 Tax=Arctium lappa TaxID=4217 RepID=A0ACB8XFP5_ARCLA|nr:hypothetical protein L6452_43994 [Arctium lappa]
MCFTQFTCCGIRIFDSIYVSEVILYIILKKKLTGLRHLFHISVFGLESIRAFYAICIHLYSFWQLR